VDELNVVQYMKDIPPLYRFYRPILWENDDEYYKYSLGGTANIVRLCGRFFILTANHCLAKDQDGWRLEDARIQYRLQSEAYCVIGRGANLSPKDPNEKDTALCDIRIHRLEGPSCQADPLVDGEFIDIQSFEESSYLIPRMLSGFPKQLQEIDYDTREAFGTGLTLQGIDGGPTNDVGCRFFRSESLKELDSKGFSGGLITTNILGTPQIEGICVQGGKYLDFVRFISAAVIQDAFRLAWHKLEEAQQAAS
jgi:hypothetical protein